MKYKFTSIIFILTVLLGLLVPGCKLKSGPATKPIGSSIQNILNAPCEFSIITTL